MSFVTDAELSAAVADRLKLAGVESLQDYWTDTIIPQANAAAYQEILGALLARGFTKATADAWDRGEEFQLSQGLFFALMNAGAYQGYDPETLKCLDRRADLANVLVFVAGEWVKPVGDKPGLITTSGPSAEGGMYNWPDPDSPELGRYTRW